MSRRATRRHTATAFITASITVLGLVLLGVTVPATAASAATSACSTTTLAQAQSRILSEVNAARAKAKVPKVIANAAMNTVATNWSKKQAAANAMKHNPSYSTQIPKGWRTAGENVAAGFAVTQVSAAWMKSAGHKANILRSAFTHIGIGMACSSSGKAYYTQVFAGYPAGVAGVTAPRKLTAGTPSIAGTPKAGLTLTARPGAWTAGTTFRYQWYVGGKAVSGATKATFVPTQAQRGKTVFVRVKGSKPGYTTIQKNSRSTARIAPLSTLTRGTPAISGSALVGGALTVTPGKWTAGTAFSYQWRAAGVAVAGATKATFVPRAADRGKSITVTVAARKAGYAGVVVTTRGTPAVAAGTLTASIPTITGAPVAGAPLTAVPRTWTAGTVFAYQWFADGAVIPGATQSVFTPTEAQVGAVLTVRVTGALNGYTSRALTSAATGPVAAPAPEPEETPAPEPTPTPEPSPTLAP